MIKTNKTIKGYYNYVNFSTLFIRNKKEAARARTLVRQLTKLRKMMEQKENEFFALALKGF